MKKLFFTITILTLLAMSVFSQVQPAPPPMTLKVGDMAPDFTLPDTAGKKVTLSEFRGKSNVVLAFFVLAFTGG
jgi:peroxiredoxin